MQTKIETVKGIGPKKAGLIHELGIYTMGDMLDFFPVSYEDRSVLTPIGEIQEGMSCFLCGTVVKAVSSYAYGRSGKLLRLKVQDDTGSMDMVYFNAGYLKRAFQEGEQYFFYGKAVRGRSGLQMVHPQSERCTGAFERRILPVYRTTKGVSQKDLRRISEAALSAEFQAEETLPPWVLERSRLCGRSFALRNIHFPADKKSFAAAKYRLIYEELFFLQTGLFLKGNARCRQAAGIAFPHDSSADEFAASLSFEMTDAQKRVLREIVADMESPVPMQRLVQGDVGSGKTAVAAAALYKAARNGWQGVLMAPTELLARQHFETFQALFRNTGIRVGFLSSSIKGQERRETLQQIEDGTTDIVIGTHAVIQDSVRFLKLGLVITDEQHRFGVDQRVRLASKGLNPDILVMTATPIPRTLAVIIFGDLDISVIDELPPGRKPISTKALGRRQRKKVYDFAAQKAAQGQQVYAVAPLVEDSEYVEAVSSQSLYEELQKKYPQLRVGLVHGNMKQKEKDDVMDRFARHEIQILVATVVIEVGINVPEATVMIIENAERFGLAQLHQLRGRVGRGGDQSYCFLITDSKSELGKERAKVIEETSDGFIIAEKDLKMRGPGDFFGTRQHGLPSLGMADLVKHMGILNDLRPVVREMLQADPRLTKPENSMVAEGVERLFGSFENLGI
ncbi:MAG: ATP-dependent DNA helicase RecG [Anaerovoracaceae bacterium]